MSDTAALRRWTAGRALLAIEGTDPGGYFARLLDLAERIIAARRAGR